MNVSIGQKVSFEDIELNDGICTKRILLKEQIKEITIDIREPQFMNVNCIIFNGKKFMLAE